MTTSPQIGCLLSGEEILRRIKSSRPLVTGYLSLEKQLQPAGFELTVESVAILKSPGTLGFSDEVRVISKVKEIMLGEKPTFLEAGTYLARYNEAVFIPCDIAALVFPRSSLMRSGAILHTAIWDPGYQGRGQGLLCVYNEHGLRLCRNARIAQLVFLKLSINSSRVYRGTYQNEGLTNVEK